MRATLAGIGICFLSCLLAVPAGSAAETPGQHPRLAELGQMRARATAGPATGLGYTVIGVPHRVQNINGIVSPGYSLGGESLQIGGLTYFTAYESHVGYELWTTDGTASGTALVKDIVAGGQSSNPGSFTELNGTLFFVAVDATFAQELWKSDGTAEGTSLVMSAVYGVKGPLHNVGGTLFFEACDVAHGCELWKSDGTAAGSALVEDIAPGPDSSYPQWRTEVNGTLFFTAGDGGLWKSDGTEAGTMLIEGSYGDPTYLAEVNGTLFFVGLGGLWKSDGTEAGTVHVANTGGSNLVDANGTLFFTAGYLDHWELWKSDGTESGTVLVKAVDSFYDGHPWDLTPVGGTIFFRACDLGAHGCELWTSDGTETGTVVIDVNPGSPGSYPFAFTSVNGMLLFAADDGVHGHELWRSDGTPAGTVLVRDVFPGAQGGCGSTPRGTNANGFLFFFANNGLQGYEPWLSNGTESGTDLLADLDAGSESSDPFAPIAAHGRLFFAARDAHGQELWKSDGTEAGTVLVKDIDPGPGSSLGLDGDSNVASVHGTVYFGASDGIHGIELWKSDGTEAGTLLVADLSPGASHGRPRVLTEFNGEVFFAALSPLHDNWGLWKSDGSEAGTAYLGVRVEGSLDRGTFGEVNGTLYFHGSDGTHNGLWKTDGTEAGTAFVKSMGSARSFTGINGVLFFTSGTSLWKSDGTEAGTVLVKQFAVGFDFVFDLTNVNGTLYFNAFDQDHGHELWKSDGTEAGTVLVLDILPGGKGSYPLGLTGMDGTLYFTAFKPDFSYTALWKSDGTAAGTVLVRDIPVFVGYTFASSSGTLYFNAWDEIHGVELWTSDGTERGTVLFHDIAPGRWDSWTSFVAFVGSRMFFDADDSVFGEPEDRELWVINRQRIHGQAGPPGRGY